MVTHFLYNGKRNAGEISVYNPTLASKALPLAVSGERVSNYEQIQGGQI